MKNMNSSQKIRIVGPAPGFKSGIAKYTGKICQLLKIEPILFKSIVPNFIFKRKYSCTTGTVVWWNPFTWRFTDADVVIIQWWTSAVAHIYLFNLLFNRKKRYVLLMHETLDPLETKTPVIRTYGTLMRHIIQKLCWKVVTHRDVAHPLYNDYEHVSNAKEQLGIEGYVIMFIGLVRDYKGVSRLIKEYMESCYMDDAVLVIAGEWWDDPTRDLSSTYKAVYTKCIEKGIIVVDNRYLTEDDMGIYLSAADVFVFPYDRAESSGMARAAICYKKPIVASVALFNDLYDYMGAVFYEGDRTIMDCINTARYDMNHMVHIPHRLNDSVIRKAWKKIVSM